MHYCKYPRWILSLACYPQKIITLLFFKKFVKRILSSYEILNSNGDSNFMYKRKFKQTYLDKYVCKLVWDTFPCIHNNICTFRNACSLSLYIYMCMYACIHMYIYICIYIYTHTHIYIYNKFIYEFISVKYCVCLYNVSSVFGYSGKRRGELGLIKLEP